MHKIGASHYMRNEVSSESGVIFITDDQKARKVANRIGIKVMGTLGFIEYCKKNGLITKIDALELVNRIKDTSLYITDSLLKVAKSKIKNQ